MMFGFCFYASSALLLCHKDKRKIKSQGGDLVNNCIWCHISINSKLENFILCLLLQKAIMDDVGKTVFFYYYFFIGKTVF